MIEGATASRRGPIRRFSLGAAGAAAEGALNIVALIFMVAWELIVVPYLARLQHEAEEKYQEALRASIQKYYDDYLAMQVERSILRLGRVIRAIEDGQKQQYVNVTLRVHYDLSLLKRFLTGPGTPDSILDLDFRGIELVDATVGTAPVREYAEPVTADNATLFFDDATEFSQAVHFSAIPPSYQELVAQYGETNVRAPQCFIATACYGSASAPEVDVLRRFRDRTLMPHPVGRRFVAWYYRHSPPVAALLARHASARWFVRTFLIAPAVAGAHRAEVGRRPAGPRPGLDPQVDRQRTRAGSRGAAVEPHTLKRG